MAVTIDDMEIDVKSGGTASAAQAPAAASAKEPVDLRQQMAMLSERSQRLTTE
ncbi:MAG TPA: hypothetical protein VGK48_20190 [Terriglobia bacterium]|jgi:hypothetical protein